MRKLLALLLLVAAPVDAQGIPPTLYYDGTGALISAGPAFKVQFPVGFTGTISAGKLTLSSAYLPLTGGSISGGLTFTGTGLTAGVTGSILADTFIPSFSVNYSAIGPNMGFIFPTPAPLAYGAAWIHVAQAGGASNGVGNAGRGGGFWFESGGGGAGSAAKAGGGVDSINFQGGVGGPGTAGAAAGSGGGFGITTGGGGTNGGGGGASPGAIDLELGAPSGAAAIGTFDIARSQAATVRIGNASGTTTITGALALTAGKTVNFGEAIVSQGTNVNTAVTCSGASGVITTQSASTAARTAETGFVVTNTSVTTASVVVAQIVAYSGTLFTNGQPDVNVTAVGSGNFTIRIINRDATNALAGTVKIHFHVL